MEEPRSKDLGHLTVHSSSARAISDGITNFLDTTQIQQTDIIALSCDGTSVNTGPKGGVIRLLEVKLNKPLHWFVCHLHANELPLHHFIDKLDGKTGGPRGFIGEMGKSLEGCGKLRIIEFERIPSGLPFVDREELSTDQKYLYDIHKSDGILSNSITLSFSHPSRLLPISPIKPLGPSVFPLSLSVIWRRGSSLTCN